MFKVFTAMEYMNSSSRCCANDTHHWVKRSFLFFPLLYICDYYGQFLHLTIGLSDVIPFLLSKDK